MISKAIHRLGNLNFKYNLIWFLKHYRGFLGSAFLMPVTSMKPRFYHDTDKGKYYAHCDGVKIIGTPSSKQVTVKWGSGHTALAVI